MGRVNGGTEVNGRQSERGAPRLAAFARRVFSGDAWAALSQTPRPLLLARGSLRRTRPVDRVSNRVSGQHQLYPPVLRPSFGCIVRGDGFGLPESSGLNGVRRKPLLHEIIPHRLRPLLRKILVVFVVTDAIRVSLHSQMEAVIRQDYSRDLGQSLTSCGEKFVPAATEQHVRHIGDQSTG